MSEFLDSQNELVDQYRALVTEVKRRDDHLEAIHSVAVAIASGLDIDAVLGVALEAVMKVVHVETACISLIDPETGDLKFRAGRGLLPDGAQQPIPFASQPDALRQALQVIEEGEPLIVADVSAGNSALGLAFGVDAAQALALVPLHAHNRVTGVLCAMSCTPYHFQEEEVLALRTVAAQVGAALEHAHLHKQANAHESRLTTILDSVADAIIATDDKGRINLVNHAAVLNFNLSPDAILGAPLHDAPLQPRLLDGLRRAMDRQRGDTMTLFEVQMENGQHWSVAVAPVRQRDQEELDDEGWVVVLQNVTHLKQVEAARTRFIQTAAHDLRNPLGITLSALLMLQGDIAPESDSHDLIDIALNAINRMQDLIDDLLHLESLASGSAIRRKPVDITKVIAKVTKDVRPMFREKSQQLEVWHDASLPTILGDENWLYRALLNYLNNAHKYTPEGGQIVVRAFQLSNELVIQVEDNGYGIPEEAQSHLFERFYRVIVTEDQPKGTGLGLAIVKSIAEQHGGRVFARSKPGEGSTFGIVLPIADIQ